MQHLTTDQLSKRWGVSSNRLRQWRVEGKGPGFIRLGDGPKAPVRYLLTDIENFERERYYESVKPE